MRPLSDTLARLAALRAGQMPFSSAQSPDLADLQTFGSNPGALSARYALPQRQGQRTPLVVILHGCNQTADGYDLATGWSRLGREHGFAVLYPRQQRSNNASLCFNWFSPDDTRRDCGEVLSIRQMIAAMVESHDVDEDKIFITGLSAGGAMAVAMLAGYPELFAGGAIIAGLAFGSATTVPEAFDRMRGHGMPSPAELSSRLKAASPHPGPWPALSVWQGDSDTTVAPGNADALVSQWRGAHGIATAPNREDMVDGHRRQVWCDAVGKDRITVYRIAGMGHGTPLDTSRGKETAADYMLDAGISSTRHIAQDWGLIPSAADVSPGGPRPTAEPRSANPMQDFFEAMLRSAGFIR